MHNVPEYFHSVNIFLLSALSVHAILFSKPSTRTIEQWIEHSARLHVHDHTDLQKRRTVEWLLKYHADIRRHMQAVFSFEGILRDNGRNSEGVLDAWQKSVEYLQQLDASFA
jgi:hypothetical protein